MLHIDRVSYLSAAPRSLSGSCMNRTSFKTKSPLVSKQARLSTASTYRVALSISRRKPFAKRRTHLLCTVCSKGRILRSPLYAEHWPFGASQQMISVSFLSMVLALERMYVFRRLSRCLFTDKSCRKRMRLISGMTSLPLSHALPATPFLLWPKRVCSDMQRVVQQHGKRLVFCKLSSRVSFLEIGTASKSEASRLLCIP